MTPPHRATGRPFTLALCNACRSPLRLVVLEELRAIVRRSEHGILVSTPCFLGELTCRIRSKDDPGPVLLMQPGSIEYAARGAATLIGPIATTEDLGIMCAWLAGGRWESDQLPARLRLDRRRAKRPAATN